VSRSVDLCDRSLPPAERERKRLLDRDFLVDQAEVDALAVTDDAGASTYIAPMWTSEPLWLTP
jgi:hypothetical protein